MQIQVNTDSSVQGDEGLEAHVRGVIEHSLGRFRGLVTRVEVHLSDENATKGGSDDKRCMMEARIEGRRPEAVTHFAGTVKESVSGAAEKLKRALGSTVDKMQKHR
ncbi:MAG: hypothetical protein EA398_00135 [Deltaproteobacteria bacterium]|nr:MAG: hypothetical protein EA398_00135 [Deltaproteobacteria bacterium]